MSRSISEHQAKVYEYAKAQGDRWFTIQEMSTAANLPDASAKNHSTRFEDSGIFERLRISPAHVFRLSPAARRRHPEMIKRLEAALPVFAARRRDWLKREAALVGDATPTANHDIEPAAQRAPLEPRTNRPYLTASGGVSLAASLTGRPMKKPDQLMALLQRADGASIDELVAHFGTQPHSIRALISTTTRDRGVKAILANGRYRVLPSSSST